MTTLAPPNPKIDLGSDIDADVDPGLDKTRPTSTGRRRYGHLTPPFVVVASYVVAAVACYWHVWSSSPSAVSMLGGDQFDSMWFLRWLPFAVAHGHNPFFSNFANYPFGVNLLTNTSSLFLGFVASPITLLWGPVAAFNLMTTAALAGSATAGYFFVRRWTTWRPAAFLGGLLYGFGPYQIGQSPSHMNLSFIVLPPLMLLVLDEIAVRQRGRARTWGVLLGLLVTAQFFVSTEVLVSTFVMTSICLVTVAAFGRRQVRTKLPYFLRSAAWTVGVAVVLLAYPVSFVFAGSGHIDGPIQLVPQGYRADLLGPFVPTSSFHFAPSALAHLADNFANSPAENGSYLGVTLVVLLVIAAILLWRRSVVARVATIAGGAAVVLSLGGALVVSSKPPGKTTGFPLPERLLGSIGVLANMIPARYSLYVDLFAALLLGLALCHLHDGLADHRLRTGGVDRFLFSRSDERRRNWLWPRVVPLAVGVVALLPLLPAVPFAGVAPVRVPTYFTTPAVTRIPAGSVAVVFPYPSPATPQPQLWQAEAGLRFRMPGGYYLVPQGDKHHIAFSSQLSYGESTITAQVLSALYQGSPPSLTTSLRTEVDAELRNWGVGTVLAFPELSPRPVRSLAYLTSLLRAPPVVQPGGAYAWYNLRL